VTDPEMSACRGCGRPIKKFNDYGRERFSCSPRCRARLSRARRKLEVDANDSFKRRL
jgi:hypothetical protein